MKLTDDTLYEERTFDGLELRSAVVKASRFELCKFIDCDFTESEFLKCKFVDCEFRDSNLSLVRFDGSRFLETDFRLCKITGVNWTSLNWTSVALVAPLVFESCDVSYSVFSALQLSELVMRHCKAHDVDFTECDLTGADLVGTDFAESRFSHTKLDRSDFRGAVNYYINPLENAINGARFSTPDVLSLLVPFKIRIDVE